MRKIARASIIVSLIVSSLRAEMDNGLHLAHWILEKKPSPS